MSTEGGEGGDFPPKKSQSNTPTTPTDFPAKKRTRQLELVLPENPQQPAAQPLVLPPPVVQTVAQMHRRRPRHSNKCLSSSPLQSQPSLSTIRPIKLESSKVQPRTTIEAKESTPQKQKPCNCKVSKCLKLYCECFASGIYCCDGCDCINCHNNVENEGARREAVDITLKRNPNAFRPKIVSRPHGVRDAKAQKLETSRDSYCAPPN